MSDPEPIPLSALQHAVYCLRQAALIHIERLWEENLFTAQGRALHETIDEPASQKRRGVRRVSSMPLASTRLGVAGVADLVEFRDGDPTPFPVEFKRGKSKLHRADEVQLCAQALCLEDMLHVRVPQGALFYAETRRRQTVDFTDELRALTQETIDAVVRLFAAGATPPAVYAAEKCRACSLAEPCRPKAGARSAKAWMEREIAASLAAVPDSKP